LSGAPGAVFHCDNSNACRPVFAPAGDLIATIDGAGVTIWDCGTGTVVGPLDDPTRGTGHVSSVAFSPLGDLIATGDSEGRVTIWDAATRRPLRVITGMQPTVWSLAFNPSGTRLAAGSQDRTIRILDPRAGEDLMTLRAHTGSVMSLAWSPDGHTLASGSYDGTVRLWANRAAPAAR
jgi:WD40 repeat protein